MAGRTPAGCRRGVLQLDRSSSTGEARSSAAGSQHFEMRSANGKPEILILRVDVEDLAVRIAAGISMSRTVLLSWVPIALAMPRRVARAGRTQRLLAAKNHIEPFI